MSLSRVIFCDPRPRRSGTTARPAAAAAVHAEPLEARRLLAGNDSDWCPADDEACIAAVPAEIAGAFLERQGVGDDKAVHFADIEQGQLDSCSLAATLSALALGDQTQVGDIDFVGVVGGNAVFDVPLYEETPAGTLAVSTERVVLAGSGSAIVSSAGGGGDNLIRLTAADMRSTDGAELWPTLYQRAYLQRHPETGTSYRSLSNAIRTISGANAQFLGSPADVTAATLRTRLAQGRPTTAGTFDSFADPDAALAYGLVPDHSYTVLDVETASDGTYVWLRNPWARDTSIEHFDANGDGDLSLGEWYAYSQGLDGVNDGIIRIPEAVFAGHFDHIVSSTRTGPSIRFQYEDTLTFSGTVAAGSTVTIREGDPLPLDLSAASAQGRPVSYELADGSPGDLNPVDGRYLWEPLSGEAGLHRVSVVASTGTGASELSFTIEVLGGAPTIDSATASPGTIDDSGTQLLTLTAHNVSSDAYYVRWFRDSDGDGVLTDADPLLQQKPLADGGDVYSNYVGGLEPGEQTFFAVARRTSYRDFHDSEPEAVSVTVTPAPQADPLITPAGPSGDFGYPTPGSGPVGTFDHFDVVTASPGGQRRVFGEFQSSAGDVFSTGLVNADGSIDEMTPYREVRGAAALDDGSFLAVYDSGSGRTGVQHVAADGTVLRTTDLGVRPDGLPLEHGAFAVDGDNVTLVMSVGYDIQNQVHVVPLTAGGAARGSVQRLDVGGECQGRPVIEARGGRVAIAFNQVTDNFETVLATSTDAGLTFTAAALGEPWATQYETQPYAVLLEDGGTTLLVGANDVRPFNDNGTPAGPSVRFTPPTTDYPSTTAVRAVRSGSGTFTLVWTQGGQESGGQYDYGVFAQLFDGATRRKLGPSAHVNSDNTANREYVVGDLTIDAGVLKATYVSASNVHPFPFTYHQRSFDVSAPPAVDPPTFEVPEDAASGHWVGRVVPQAAGDYRFEVLGDAPVTAHATNGAIRVRAGADLDHEAAGTLVVNVRVSAAANAAASVVVPVTLRVTDANDVADLDIAATDRFFEENAAAMSLIPAARYEDVDEADMNGGLVRVRTITGARPENRLWLDQSNDRLTLVGNEVYVDNELTGLLTRDGTGRTTFQIRLRRDATPQRVEVVLRALRWRADGDEFNPTRRTFEVMVSDGDGGVVLNRDTVIRPLRVNDDPIVTGVSGQITATAGVIRKVFPGVAVEDPDSANFRLGRAKIRIASGAAATDELFIRENGGGANRVELAGTGVRYGGLIVGTFSGGQGNQSLLINFYGRATQPIVERVLRSVFLRTDADGPLNRRRISFDLTDGDGGSGETLYRDVLMTR